MDRPLLEDDLLAYVDDALDADMRRRVEHYLDSHPEAARRVQGYLAQRENLRAALASIAQEPIPAALNLSRLVDAHRSTHHVPWKIAASVVLAFTLGGAGGWILRGGPLDHAGVTALAREAVSTYLVYATDPTRPVELRADNTSELVNWVSQRLNRAVSVPDLSQSGYRYMGGRLVATEHGPAALFMYDDDRGTRVTMLVRPMKAQSDMKMVPHRQDAVVGYSWADQGLGYSLMSNLEPDSIHRLADETRRQLTTRRADS
ncbi:anti-sigma factor family protein [Achromobacter xylosoxidans]